MARYRVISLLACFNVLFLGWMSCYAPVAMAQTETETPTPAPTMTPTPTPIAINTELMACWDMDESSGPRVDSEGGNHLTDNNTVGYAGGKHGNSALFVRANSEYLSIADNAYLSVQDISYTWVGWFYVNSFPGYQAIFEKGESGAEDYALFYETGSNNLIFRSYNGVTTADQVTHTGAKNTSAWYFFAAIRNKETGLISLAINNGTPVTAPITLVQGDTTKQFTIGQRVGTWFFDGRVEELAFWKRALTQEELTWIYNDGAGRPCRDIISPPPPEYETDVQASSGNHYVIERRITYGDIATVVTGGILIILLVVGGIVLGVQKWLP